MLSEAARQLNAAGKAPIEWHVAEKEAAAIKQLLADNGYGAIKVIYDP